MSEQRAVLIRFQTGNQGTFGKIVVGAQSWFTGELPWMDNQNDISCIPVGIYRAKQTFSPHMGRITYELSGVSKRANVRIHSANLMGSVASGFKTQLLGCIALGEQMGTMDGQKCLLLSRSAIRQFEDALDHKPFTLEIKNGTA